MNQKEYFDELYKSTFPQEREPQPNRQITSDMLPGIRQTTAEIILKKWDKYSDPAKDIRVKAIVSWLESRDQEYILNVSFNQLTHEWSEHWWEARANDEPKE